MQPLLQSEIVWRLIIAALLGALLGLERSLAGKHAGMRTYSLVALGSSLFVIVGTLSSFELSMFSGINPSQIASSVVVGIGFIGAGLAALRARENESHPELTTASGIWLAAGVGMAVGYGLYSIGVAAALLGLFVFWLLAKVEHTLRVRWGKGYAEHNSY